MTNIPSKRLIILQIFLIFVLPVILLYFNLVHESWRFFFLCVGALAIYGILVKERWTHQEMGLRHDNIRKSLPYYLLFTIFGVGSLFLLRHSVNLDVNISQSYFFQTLILFLPISFFQEFAFRSFLVPRLQLVCRNNFQIIFINTLLFTAIHVIYPSLMISLPLAFVAGIFFAWLYIKYPNLLLISLAHAATNIVAVLLGFFTIG